MFDKDFYPTPDEIILHMVNGSDLNGKVVLEPSAGSGNIVDFCIGSGATVLACEANEDLAKIVARKAKFLKRNFFDVESHEISHINAIYMNPPFSQDEKHILHAWEIAPSGCEIVALCNWNTLSNDYTRSRKELLSIITNYGTKESIGNVFNDADRQTDAQIGLIRLYKPASNNDFADYFTSEDDDDEVQQNGLMSYNVIREIVQRYVNAVKLYDQVIDNGIKMNSLIGEIIGHGKDLVFTCTSKDQELTRNEFAKELQKKSWNWVFNKMNMKKYATKSLMEDINKFVEQQKNVPFTMKNIYKMIEIVIGTNAQRMDKALLEVFDTLTKHYNENRYNVEGWKTNSHYLVNRKFIKPYLVSVGYSGGIDYSFGRKSEELEDMIKALCIISGQNYDNHLSFYQRLNSNIYEKDGRYKIISGSWEKERFEENNPDWTKLSRPTFGEWFDWGFFEVKVFKKGTGHFKFKDENVWALFNQNIARIKGFPLPENIKKAA